MRLQQLVILLNKSLQTKKYKNLFFAGQLTGVEGYCESISTGLLSAINMDRMLKGKKLIELNNKTMLGALIDYITFEEHKKLQPINSNWGIVEEVIGDRKKLKDKNYKNQIRSQRALEEIEQIKKIIEE